MYVLVRTYSRLYKEQCKIIEKNDTYIGDTIYIKRITETYRNSTQTNKIY